MTKNSGTTYDYSWATPTTYVTQFTAGNLSPLFTISVLNPTTTPDLSFALSNASPGTVFGNAGTSSAAPSYTVNPVLGKAGTTAGGITVSSSTAGAVFIGGQGSSASWNLFLPTGAGSSGQFLTSAAGGTTTWTTPTNGTVTSVSVADLSPIFTSGVINATTAAAVNYTLTATGGTYKVLGSATNAAPTYTSIDTTYISSFYTKVRSLFTAGCGITITNGEISLTTCPAPNPEPMPVPSDERLKIISGNYTGGLNELMKIKTINYNWNDISGRDKSLSHVGFSAQNIKEILPEAVTTNKEGYYTLEDRAMIALLVNSVQELKKEIEILKAKK